MWTYRNNVQLNTTSPASTPFKSTTSLTNINSVIMSKRNRNSVQYQGTRYNFFVLKLISFLYVLGIFTGTFVCQFCNSQILNYLKHYTTSTVARFTEKQYLIVFSTGFLSLFFQLTLIVLSGLCVLGILFIPGICFLKGIGTGCFFSLIYLEFGFAKGLFLQILFFLIPEIMGVILVFSISLMSWNVSKNLFNGCFRIPHNKLSEYFKKMLYRYIKLCLFCSCPCTISILSAFIFSPLF